MDHAVPPDRTPLPPCGCGRRFLDDLMADLYGWFHGAGIFQGDEPLSAVGTPLISPGIFLRSPPFLPTRSLLLITDKLTRGQAEEIFASRDQLLGILSGGGRPGAGDQFGDPSPGCESALFCGCDVRGDLFLTRNGPVLIYKKQGATHLEFPKGSDPKIRSLEEAVHRLRPAVFFDACCGAGTLGLAAVRLGVREIILVDIWYAAAYFAAFNLHINREALGLEEIVLHHDFQRLADKPVRHEPVLVGEGRGPGCRITVWHGDLRRCIPDGGHGPVLTAFDPFDKQDHVRNSRIMEEIRAMAGGEVFIP